MKAALSQYEIDIQMSQDTVEALTEGGYGLTVFKAVQSTVVGAAPLIWFQTDQLLLTTSVTWQEQYQAYISTSPILSYDVIRTSSTTDLGLGQAAQVNASGVMTVTEGETASAITILNQANQSWTCGISQAVEGQANPICAIPLHENLIDVITPVDQVLLSFSNMAMPTGTVVLKTNAAGVLVDLSSAPQRTVQFDINNGWSWGGETWAQSVETNANLVPLLVQ